MKNRLTKLLEIYITFFKLGAFSFGGGYAMIPLIERETVEVKKWITQEEIIDVFAAAQSIPGAIAMNASGFVGYRILGVPGALAAVIGNLTPPAAIVLTLSILFSQFSDVPVVQEAFIGIRPAIIGLIAYAAFKLGRTAIVDKATWILMFGAFLVVMLFGLHPIVVIVLGGVAGILITRVNKGTLRKPASENVDEGGDQS